MQTCKSSETRSCMQQLTRRLAASGCVPHATLCKQRQLLPNSMKYLCCARRLQVQGELQERDADMASQSQSFEITRSFLASQVFDSSLTSAE